jgi:hypothetical protein
MGRSIAERVGTIIGVASLLLAACGSSNKTTPSAEQGGDASVDATVICLPGARRCDGSTIKVCNPTGTQEAIQQTCPADQTCSQGACVERACVPNGKFCSEGAIWKCDGSGVTSTVVERCGAGSYCHAEGNDVTCADQACTNGDPLCEANVATTCLSNGSGPKPGGVDCSITKQLCYKGECRDVACVPGGKLCQHDDVFLCGDNGTELSLWADCQANEVCDADQGACRAKLCEPGKVVCDGSRVATCNAFGSAWLSNPKDCADDGKICVAGSCKTQVCGSSSSFCQEGELYSCDSTGTVATHVTCQNNSHCVTSGSYAYCAADACIAGQPACRDNVIVTCNDDGSLPATGGTACGEDQQCDAGVCVNRCQPNTTFCKGNDIYVCQWDGTPGISQYCDGETKCAPAGGGYARCAPFACSPSTTACIGNKIGTCGDDGGSLSAVSKDCTATSTVCTSAFTCAASATDAIGVEEHAELLYASTVTGNVIQVSSARKMTELQMQLRLDSPVELRWVVYEESGQNFVAKADKVVKNVSGEGYLSSGLFDPAVPLKAGKRYLFAVAISGTDGFSSYDLAPFPGNTSFGVTIGRISTSYAPTIYQEYVSTDVAAQMKIVTQSP